MMTPPHLKDIVYDRPKTLDSTFDAGGDTSSTLIAVSNMCEFVNIQTILGGHLIKTKRTRTQIFPRELDYDAAIWDLWKFLVQDIFKYLFRFGIFSGTSWAAVFTSSVLPSCPFASSRGLQGLRPSRLSSELGAFTCHNNSDIDKRV